MSCLACAVRGLLRLSHHLQNNPSRGSWRTASLPAPTWWPTKQPYSQTQATTVDEAEVAGALAGAALDPEPYADLAGGLKMFKQALDIMVGLSDADFATFTSLPRLDDITLAVVKSVMAAAGAAAGPAGAVVGAACGDGSPVLRDTCDSPVRALRNWGSCDVCLAALARAPPAGELGEGGDWDVLRGRLSRSLIQRLAAMDPQVRTCSVALPGSCWLPLLRS